MLFGEIVWIRLKDGFLDLGPLLSVPVSVLVLHVNSDLVLNLLLFGHQIGLAHDLLVENGSSLLQGRLKEPLPHLLDDFICSPIVETGELDPLTEEARSDLYAMPQVQSVVLSPAEDREEELGDAHVVTTAVLEDGRDDQKAD